MINKEYFKNDCLYYRFLALRIGVLNQKFLLRVEQNQFTFFQEFAYHISYITRNGTVWNHPRITSCFSTIDFLSLHTHLRAITRKTLFGLKKL